MYSFIILVSDNASTSSPTFLALSTVICLVAFGTFYLSQKRQKDHFGKPEDTRPPLERTTSSTEFEDEEEGDGNISVSDYV